MHYNPELTFLQKILSELHVPSQRVALRELESNPPDFGLRALLGREPDIRRILGIQDRSCAENTVYKSTDAFDCSYIFLRLPDMPEPTLFLIGPYLSFEITREHLQQKAAQLQIGPDLYPRFESVFSHIPYLEENASLMAMLSALGAKLWGSSDVFEVIDIAVEAEHPDAVPGRDAASAEAEDVVQRMKLLEARYAYENEIIALVARGRGQKANLMLRHFSQLVLENRTPEPMRNLKNYTIIFNTLLRKAVEQGGAHPYYIDLLSSQFARKIERMQKWEEFQPLLQSMVAEYSLLIRKHAGRSYSPLVQKVIARVDFDLTADQSLNAHATHLNVSPGYLSGLFRKETGETLTNFVTARRMEHAAYLLRSTRQSVSDIAQACGIADDNYFTKLFKKHTGKTPMQFRKEPQARWQKEKN